MVLYPRVRLVSIPVTLYIVAKINTNQCTAAVIQSSEQLLSLWSFGSVHTRLRLLPVDSPYSNIIPRRQEDPAGHLCHFSKRSV